MDVPLPSLAAVAFLRVTPTLTKPGQDEDRVKAFADPVMPDPILVYEGIANDTVVIPTVGPIVASGTAQGQVPARNAAEIVLSGSAALAPGG